MFNGEIYNYQELSAELLQRPCFQDQTDTEVIVHLYEEYGESCVEKLRGMFAFAIWDERQKMLFLGARPGRDQATLLLAVGKVIVFGSEIKAILVDPEVRQKSIRRMIDRFLSFYYVPGEETLFKEYLQTGAGNYTSWREKEVSNAAVLGSPLFRSPHQSSGGEQDSLSCSRSACGMHMISRCARRILLSGGVDSTAMLDFRLARQFPAQQLYAGILCTGNGGRAAIRETRPLRIWLRTP